MALGLEIEESSLFSVGDYLRGVNQEIKAALVDIGQQPVGSVPVEVARSLHNLQLTYEQARVAYETVYRAAYGTVPTGLAALPVGIAAWAAWQWLVAAVVAGGLLYTAVQAFRDTVRYWREGLRAEQGQRLPPVESSWEAWIMDNLLLVGVGGVALILLLRR